MQNNGATPDVSSKDLEAKFGAAVRAHRISRRVSQRELAEELRTYGISTDGPSISRLEKGSRAVRLAEAVAIAQALEMSIDDLLYEFDARSQLESLRRSANYLMNLMAESAEQWIEKLLAIRALLVSRPDLVPVLNDDALGPPDSADTYLEWVTARVTNLAQEGRISAGDDTVHLDAANDDDLKAIRELLNATIERVVTPASDRRESVARGLTALIPTAPPEETDS